MEPESRPLRKRVYFLPNMLTAGNLFAGFYAIIAAVNSEFERAAVALIVAGILDILDGKIARFTGGSSRFGVEFDSLADLVSFGVGPAVLIYLWALKPFGRLGWVAAFLLVACGALRLARFNVQTAKLDRRWFVGLPIPAACASISTTVLVLDGGADLSRPVSTILILQVYLLAFLMVSTIRYRSFKDLGMRQRRPFSFLLSVIFLLSIIALHPQVTLFAMAATYVGSGPFEAAVAPLRRGHLARHHPKGEGKTGK